jgi:hypothetical protein
MQGDSAVDLFMSQLYAMTPTELRTPFNVSADLLSPTRPAQLKRIVKLEDGVFVSGAGPSAVWPSIAKIIQPDVQLAGGSVLHITDQAMMLPMKTTAELIRNGQSKRNRTATGRRKQARG